MSAVVFGMPGNEPLAASLARTMGATPGALEVHRFPDGESCPRVLTPVADCDAVLACTLDRPDDKLPALYLAASTLRDLGARRVILVAPYLAYMRQDRRFHDGEGISSRYVARWLSGFLDGLVTVDPHLHRIHALGEIYSIPTAVVPAAPAIARWLATQVEAPLLIGPDAESAQWVASVAALAACPHAILNKERHGDRDVDVSGESLAAWRDRTPVLIDDIISTGRTLIAALALLRQKQMKPPLCVGVHAIFAGAGAEDLVWAGAARVVTCNTVAHATNAIDLHPSLAQAALAMLGH